jgi:hypothetical protein
MDNQNQIENIKLESNSNNEQDSEKVIEVSPNGRYAKVKLPPFYTLTSVKSAVRKRRLQGCL